MCIRNFKMCIQLEMENVLSKYFKGGDDTCISFLKMQMAYALVKREKTRYLEGGQFMIARGGMPWWQVK